MRAMVPLKRFVDPNRALTYGIVQAGPDTPGGIPYIRPVDMSQGRGVLDENALQRTTPAIAAQYTRSEVRAGDIVLSIGPSFGKVMIVPNSLDGANLTQGTARIAPRSGVSNRFLYWALQSGTASSFWESAVGGATFRSLNLGPLSLTPIPNNTIDQQLLAADFLDRETARIDALIRKQELLIMALRQRRQTLVEDSVTMGLELAPQVETDNPWPMKVPEHWEMVPAKAVFRERREPNRVEDVHLTPSQNHGVLSQAEYIERSGSRVVLNLVGQDSMKHVEENDFIIHLRSFQGGIEQSRLEGKVSTAYTVLTPRRGADPEYFRWLLKSTGYIQALRSTTNQLRDGQSIKYPDFAKVRLPLPPLDEQRRIAAFLDERTAKNDALIEKAERFIELAKERRAALITAAVTGQIDVTAKAVA